jgi:hypothetical protein
MQSQSRCTCRPMEMSCEPGIIVSTFVMSLPRCSAATPAGSTSTLVMGNGDVARAGFRQDDRRGMLIKDKGSMTSADPAVMAAVDDVGDRLEKIGSAATYGGHRCPERDPLRPVDEAARHRLCRRDADPRPIVRAVRLPATMKLLGMRNQYPPRAAVVVPQFHHKPAVMPAPGLIARHLITVAAPTGAHHWGLAAPRTRLRSSAKAGSPA